MNLIDPADAYRRLDRRENAAIDRLEMLTAWAKAANRDLTYHRHHPGQDTDGHAMTLAAWANIDTAYNQAYAELAWIDAERNLLDAELARLRARHNEENGHA